MGRQTYYFTSESVSEGHPDKVSDRISDEIVDLYFRKSVAAGMSPWDVRVAAETLTTTNKVVIAGETPRAAIKDIGYEQSGFHHAHADVEVLLHAQSVDIAAGVDEGTGLHTEQGAGDQGIMFGYASTEVEGALMPAPIYYSHKILERLAEVRHSGTERGLEPDAKSQVSVRYEDGKPVAASAIVVSTQHADGLSSANISDIVMPFIGGPDGDAGLTGRKIIVDTYGGMAPHGGGAFSGKDPTKVDRSAAYASRYLAKNVVASGLVDWANIQLSYAIGVAEPTSIYVELDGKHAKLAARLEEVLPTIMSLTPRGIRSHLNLNQAIYARTAAYGHFGRTPDGDGGFSWEKTDLVDAIKAAV